MPTVNLTTADDIAVVEIANPPVNALSHGVPEGLVQAIEEAERNPAIRAIVILGAGRTFVAGADIKDLERAAWDSSVEPPDIHDLLTRVEDAAKPVVMAIHGTALGGGLELAMAGHYRVATPDALLGQQEGKSGLIPGAGGPERLPRLAGVVKAADMCAFGEPISAKAALEARIINRI